MPAAIKDEEMLNHKFGKWLVLEKLPHEPGKAIKWKCQCECGTVKNVDGRSLRAGRS